jgi:O-antigen/teichoic acid export membrane protein
MDQELATTVGRGMFWTTGSTILLKFVALASVFLILSRLSVYEFGLTELVLSIIPILDFLLVPSITSVVSADMSVEKGAGNTHVLKAIYRSFFRLQFIMAIIAWAIVFFGANVISAFFHEEVVSLLQLVSFLFLLAPFRTAAQLLFSVYLKFFEQSLFSIIDDIGKLLFLVLFFFLFGMKAEGVLLATIACQTLTILIMLFFFIPLYRKELQAIPEGDFSIWHILFAHGKWNIIGNYVSTLAQNLVPWIIKILLGTEAVGLYSLAQGMYAQVTSLFPLNKVMTTIIPQYLQDRRHFFRIAQKAIKYQLLGYVFTALFAYIVLPPVISLLFPKYIPSLGLFRILLIGLIPVAFNSIFALLYYSLKAQRDLFFASVYKGILTIIFIPVGIKLFGIWGIPLADITVFFVYTFERYRRIKKLLPGFSIELASFVKIEEDDRLIIGNIREMLLRKIPFFS